MTHANRERRFVILIHDRGYLQPRQKLGELETARTFDDQVAAGRVARAYLCKRGTKGTVAEVIERPTKGKEGIRDR